MVLSIMAKIYLTLSFSFLFIITSVAQTDSEWLFDDSVLPEVHILIDQDSLDIILQPGNQNSNYEFPATFVFQKESETDTVTNIGFRLRGNTSRNSAKKSFKVSFNTFEKGREYRGLDKMNLNGEHNDPSIIRSKISWDIFERIGLTAPRANHVKLYINNEYYGLYINVEHIDNEFVENRFGSDAGNLYKCLYPADLSYISSNPGDYKWSPVWASRRVYDLKTNTEADDYSDLAFLISFLETASPTQFEEEIENYLNVDGVLRWMAVDILTGNWDNYWYNQNNFYLYNDPVSNRFEFIPYDYDNTLGIDFLGPDWGNRNINNWGPSGANRPLTSRILEVEDYKNRLNFYINQIIEQVFNEDFLFGEIDRIKALVEDAAEEDTYRTLDYNYGIGEYHASFNSAIGGHVKYGLKPYITERVNSALEQLELENIKPIIRSFRQTFINIDPLPVITFNAEIIDETIPSVQATIFEQNDLDVKSLIVRELFDNGESPDKVAGDGIYSGQYEVPLGISSISYVIQAQDGEANTSYSRETRFEFKSDFNSIVINEFMADNETGIQDTSGAYEDWIELYNPTDKAINLKNYFLTDDFSIPEKWALPDTTIIPGGFLLVWADNDDEEGPLHTNFGLSNNGEQIGLYFKDILETLVADSISFDEQNDDISYGREGDGGETFNFFDTPTPGFSNGIINPIEDEKETPTGIQLFQNYPNPFNPETTISFRLNEPSDIQLEIFTIEGRIVQTLADSRFLSGTHSFRFNASSLSSGMYFYRLKTKNQSLTKRLVLIK